MTQWHLLILLLAGGVVWTGLWLRVITSVPYVEPEGVVDQKTVSLRRRVSLPFILLIAIGVIFSLLWMPYPRFRENRFGPPELNVEVTALQWAWQMSQDTVPVGKSIEFNISSKDVNHNFAIYSPEGALLTQAQAMPGYTNKLIFKFDKPGTYTIRCLEYCGLAHHFMIRTITVE